MNLTLVFVTLINEPVDSVCGAGVAYAGKDPGGTFYCLMYDAQWQLYWLSVKAVFTSKTVRYKKWPYPNTIPSNMEWNTFGGSSCA